MDYRRRYVRRFGAGSQNQPTQIEEKIIIEKTEEKPRFQNVYMQRIIEKTKETPKTTAINISSVNENIPSFKTNIRDILSTDENKQKAINYVIHKRNEEKYGARSPIAKKDEEESNPVFSNRYFRNSRNINDRGNVTTTRIEIKEVTTSTNEDTTKPLYSHYYSRRNKHFTSSENNPQNSNQNDNNTKKEQASTPFIRRRFQASSSTKNMNNDQNSSNVVENKEKNTNNSVYHRKFRRYYMNSNVNNDNNTNNDNKSQNDEKNEPEEEKPRYRYLRGYMRRYENEQNSKSEKKDLNKPIENLSVNYNAPINLKRGSPSRFGIKDNDLDDKSKDKDTDDKNKFKNYKNFRIIRNSFALNEKKKYDITYSGSRRYGRQKYRSGDSQEKNGRYDKKDENIRERVIEYKILSNNNKYPCVADHRGSSGRPCKRG